MKQSPGFLKGFLILLGILLAAALYAALVLFPIVEDISQLKRDKKDLVLQIEDFKQQAHRFFVIDDKEKSFMKRDSKLLMEGIPVLSSSSAIEAFTGEVKRAILRLAGDLELPEHSIVLAEDAVDLEERFGPLGLDRSYEIKEGQWVFPYSSAYRPLYVAVSAPLPQALRFLNRLPASQKRYLGVAGIHVVPGTFNPLVIISLRLHYCEANGCKPVHLIEYAGEHGVIVDNDAEILLERVYWHTEKDIERKSLPRISGAPLFVRGSR